jgi:hypothetical protein
MQRDALALELGTEGISKRPCLKLMNEDPDDTSSRSAFELGTKKAFTRASFSERMV